MIYCCTIEVVARLLMMQLYNWTYMMQLYN